MYVINKDEDQWWTVQHESGRTGQVPVPYVQVVRSVVRETSSECGTNHYNFRFQNRVMQ